MSAVRGYAVLVGIVFLLGCDQGPQRYEVTGSITYDGNPVPNGRLVFTPDNSAGNQGPQGVAVVAAGAITTEEDRRMIGGPHWVQIMAFDGNAFEDGEGTVDHGRPLCPLVQAPIELPHGDVEVLIEITQGPEEATATIELVGEAE